MMDLGRIHTYYSYSLASFVTIFNRAIDSVSGDNDPMFPPDREEAEATLEGGRDSAHQSASRSEGSDAGSRQEGQSVSRDDGTAAVEGAPATAAAPPESTADVAPASHETAATDPAAAGLSSESTGTRVKYQASIRTLSDAELVQRCAILKDATTSVTFKFVNRGLFEKDRLTVAAHLCFKLLLDSGELSEALVRALVVGPSALGDPGPVAAALADWMPDSVWARARALESVKPTFEHLTEDMSSASSTWKAWFDAEKPEVMPLPGDYSVLSNLSIHALLLLRVLRPDRLTAGLHGFISSKLGEPYVLGEPFSMPHTFEESSVTTPIFFVLFPGVDPTVWVEALGRQKGITQDNGRLVNISMGQGQEARAMKSLKELAASGGWVLLQNVHLMTSWLPQLERQLELLQEGAHADFRCFISAEPPPMSHMKNMPESLLQSCIKVANEAPAGMFSASSCLPCHPSQSVFTIVAAACARGARGIVLSLYSPTF